MTNTILIVDDSRVDQRLIGGLLRVNSAYRIEFAENGKEALEKMAMAPPNLVVTDLVMPEMNGLALVREIRVRYPQVPAILMTAHGNEDTAMEAMAAGAVSYVPKAQQAERLLLTADRVMARADSDRYRRGFGVRLNELYCSYSLDNDPGVVAPLVDQIQHTLSSLRVGDRIERIRTCVALEEALLNAIYHGNLEIDKGEMAKAHADFEGERLTLLAEELAEAIAAAETDGLPQRQDREVTLDAHISAECARFVIRDGGHGFDHESLARRRLSDYFECGESRGLMLMRLMMDEVSFNSVGNEVTLVKTND